MGRRPLLLDLESRVIERILDGRLKPGDPVPQAILARELGVSPIPLRETLRALAVVGLVQFTGGQGVTIVPLSIRGMVENTELAIVLESLALRTAFPHLDEAVFARLEETLLRLEDIRSAREGFPLAWEFYHTLLAPSGFEHVLELIRGCILRAILAFPLYAKVRTKVAADGPNLRTVYEACRAGHLEGAIQALETFNRNANRATVALAEAQLGEPGGPGRIVP